MTLSYGEGTSLINKIILLILQEFLQWLCAPEGKPERDHPDNSTSIGLADLAHGGDANNTCRFPKAAIPLLKIITACKGHSNLTLTQQVIATGQIHIFM